MPKILSQAQIEQYGRDGLAFPAPVLEADDGELTRTNKVRRGFIGERYKTLVDALYGGAKQVHIKVDVTFEDGRKGTIEGDIEIRDLVPQHARPLRKAG